VIAVDQSTHHSIEYVLVKATCIMNTQGIPRIHRSKICNALRGETAYMSSTRAPPTEAQAISIVRPSLGLDLNAIPRTDTRPACRLEAPHVITVAAQQCYLKRHRRILPSCAQTPGMPGRESTGRIVLLSCHGQHPAKHRHFLAYLSR
jgi:hypothetical protein